MNNLETWLSENKWLTLSDHFHGHKKAKNDLHTFTGLCQKIDAIWDEIFHNQDWMEEYINRCDLQNVLYTKHALDALKLRLSKLETNLKYKGEALMNKEDISGTEAIRRAKEYPIGDIVEFNRAGMAKCIFHNDKDPSMHWYVSTNTVRCFSCNRSWDAIDVYMQLRKCDFQTAVKELQ
jgi:hypothetical protein